MLNECHVKGSDLHHIRPSPTCNVMTSSLFLLLLSLVSGLHRSAIILLIALVIQSTAACEPSTGQQVVAEVPHSLSYTGQSLNIWPMWQQQNHLGSCCLLYCLGLSALLFPQALYITCRPQPSYKQSSSRTSSHPGQHYWWHETRQESDDSEDDAFASNADYGSNFY